MVVVSPPGLSTGSSIEQRLSDLDVRSPIDPDAASQWRAAPRLESLAGKSGGFLGNKKANAEVLLKEIKELMDKQFELQEGVVVDKFIYSRPASDEIIETLAANCDFVITAIAD
jgi:hypothetical protein